MPYIEGAIGPYLHPGTAIPVNGTDELQTLDINATGGTFKLAFMGFTTSAISWSAVNATLIASIDAALGALPSIADAANVTVAAGTAVAGVGTFTITFVAGLGRKAVPTITVANNSLTGVGTLTVVETTPGVDATYRGAATGAFIVATGSGANLPKIYVNVGTPAAPDWKVVTQAA